MSHPQPFDAAVVLDALGASLPPALVDPAMMEPLRAFAADLPAVWNWGMLECRLAASDAAVDLLTCCSDVGPARAAMALAVDRGNLDLLAPGPARQVKAWSRSAAPVAASPQLWFEWETLARAANNPLIWFGADAAFFEGPSAPPVDDPCALALACLGQQVADIAPFEPAVRRVQAALPEGGRLLGIGSLRPRGRNALRMFCALPDGGFSPWLQAIGWPGDLELAERHRAAARAPLEPVFVQLEAEPELNPYLGIEARQTVQGFPSRRDRASWLRFLCRDGLADRAKADALLAWPGRSRLSDGRTLHRSFHIKVALRPDGPQAKGYLGFAALG